MNEEGQMEKAGKEYNLEKRTLAFAKDIRVFVKRLPRTVANVEDVKQLVRASGSVGANYIEANEALGKRDFLMRMRISRKEAKEAGYWLQLLDVGDNCAVEQQRQALVLEAEELMKIFGAIVRKLQRQ